MLKKKISSNSGESYKKAPVPLDFVHHDSLYVGEAWPLPGSCKEGMCSELDIILNAENLGTIIYNENKTWSMRNVSDQELVNRIGEEIVQWYA